MISEIFSSNINSSKKRGVRITRMVLFIRASDAFQCRRDCEPCQPPKPCLASLQHPGRGQAGMTRNHVGIEMHLIHV